MHNINSYKGKYYNPQNEEIFKGNITNEIPMNCKDMVFYNDMGNIIYDSNLYNNGYLMKENKNCKIDYYKKFKM